jgi:hypothetical protein
MKVEGPAPFYVTVCLMGWMGWACCSFMLYLLPGWPVSASFFILVHYPDGLDHLFFHVSYLLPGWAGPALFYLQYITLMDWTFSSLCLITWMDWACLLVMFNTNWMCWTFFYPFSLMHWVNKRMQLNEMFLLLLRLGLLSISFYLLYLRY